MGEEHTQTFFFYKAGRTLLVKPNEVILENQLIIPHHRNVKILYFPNHKIWGGISMESPKVTFPQH